MPTVRKRPKVQVPRLPPGAVKHHEWNGTTWNGTLTVLGVKFSSSNTSEQKNLWSLDRRYRVWLAKQSDEVKAKHTEHLK